MLVILKPQFLALLFSNYKLIELLMMSSLNIAVQADDTTL